MAGYTRNDGPNNISDGNVINSSDLDGEYDAIEAAFNNSTGHTHDGTAAEGAPIEVVGPAQDLVVTAAKVEPKTDNTLDLGSSTKEFKDLYIDGTAYIDGLGENILVATDKAIQFRDSGLSINSSADGQLDIDADTELELTAPTMDINASTTVTVDTADLVITGDTSATGAVDITGDLDVDNININGNTISSTDTNGNIALTPDGTGEVDISKVDIDSGTIDGVTIGGASAGAGTFNALTVDGGTTNRVASFISTDANALIEFADDTTTNRPAIGADGNDMTFNTNGEKVRIDNDGNVGIGTTSPSTHLHIQAPEETAKLRLQRSGSTNASDADLGEIEFFNSDGTSDGPNVSAKVTASTYTGAGAGGQLKFHTHDGTEAGGEGSDPVERMRIDGIGNVGIGTTSFNERLRINGNSNATARIRIQNQGTDIAFLGSALGIAGSPSNANDLLLSSASTNNLVFGTNTTERMRIDSSGNLLVGKTASDTAEVGLVLNNNGRLYATTSNSDDVLYLNRQGSDGKIIRLAGQNVEEGNISVSGTTVSYNGGHLSRWSRLADDSKDTSIVKGTVMTNLDEMVVWSHDAVEAQDAVYETQTDDQGNEIQVLVSEAVEAKEAYTEDNEQLNKMAVSSVEGDPNVAGVFVNWDEEDDFNDMNIAMTGDMVIRIAQGNTVARGDLLMSAGDGTAKPQGDDIVRSRTIAKVTSTHVSHTYNDGSYLVPCVLMAC